MPITAAPTEAIAALAFVLSGIPVYYLTQPSKYDGLPLALRSQSISLAWIKGIINKLRVRSPAAEGWEAVAVEETVEVM